MNTPWPINDPAQMSSDMLRRAFVYWRDKARGRIGPKRDEISPQDLKFVLPWVWMWEVVDGGRDFHFRLGGERIKAFMGEQGKIQRLSEFPPSEFADEVRYVFRECVKTRMPLIVGPARTLFAPRSYHTVTNIVLPLSENYEDVTMLIGATEVQEQAALVPA